MDQAFAIQPQKYHPNPKKAGAYVIQVCLMTWEIFGLSVPTIQEYVNKMVYNLFIYLFKMVVILRKMTFIKIMFINNNCRPVQLQFSSFISVDKYVQV